MCSGCENLDGEKLFYGASLINQNPSSVKSFLEATEEKRGKDIERNLFE
jgi:hypothetical protein